MTTIDYVCLALIAVGVAGWAHHMYQAFQDRIDER